MEQTDDVTYDFDVIIVTDCRLPGGTAASTAEEIAAQARFGARTGLIHLDSHLVSRTRPLNPRIRSALDRGEAELLIARRSVSTELLVIRHPTVALGVGSSVIPRVRAANCVVLVNQEPVTGPNVHYRASEVNAAVWSWVGLEPLWAPIGPLVRDRFVKAEPDQPLMEDDWVNIIDVDAWARARGPVNSAPIRVGRHSRDHRLKWPATREQLFLAYPVADDMEVHVLGGVAQALTLLGGRCPANWVMHPFGSIEPKEFLRELDVYVYFHHPDLTEAFGRTILEAMASGLPVITDQKFQPLFADSVIYVTPSEVAATVRRLADAPEDYMRYSRAGQEFARRRFGYEEHRRRLGKLIPSWQPLPAVAEAMDGGRVESDGSGRTVLFISPNGAGMGHLTRVMAVANRLPSDVEARFFTFSTAAGVVAGTGHLVDYFPSRGVTRSASSGWHAAVTERLEEVVANCRPDAVVIDGTDPYRGILRMLSNHPEIPVVWLRRGMWKQGVSNAVNREGVSFFDLVIAPGELAAEVDHGATTRAPDLAAVAPITYLDEDDLLDRDAARASLGLAQHEHAILVNLGAGNINDTGSVLDTVVEVLTDTGRNRVFTVRSPIASGDGALAESVTVLDLYPLARYLHAFDMAVSAVGYNGFHELLLSGVPTLFVPNDATITDDQRARAQWAHDRGAALCAASDEPEVIRRALEQLLDPAVRASMSAQLGTVVMENGAQEAADLTMQLSTSKADVDARSRERKRVYELLETTARGRPAAKGQRRSGFRELPLRVLETTRRRVGDKRLRRLVETLPPAVNRRLRRLVGLSEDVIATSPTAPLRVPPGILLGDVDEGSLERVLVIIDPQIGNHQVVEAVAKRQAIERTFAPVFLTSSLDAGVFRKYGYVWDYLRPESSENESAEDWVDRRQRRIGQLVRWYGPGIVVEAACIDDLTSDNSLLAHLVRELDPTVRRG